MPDTQCANLLAPPVAEHRDDHGARDIAAAPESTAGSVPIALPVQTFACKNGLAFPAQNLVRIFGAMQRVVLVFFRAGPRGPEMLARKCPLHPGPKSRQEIVSAACNFRARAELNKTGPAPLDGYSGSTLPAPAAEARVTGESVSRRNLRHCMHPTAKPTETQRCAALDSRTSVGRHQGTLFTRWHRAPHTPQLPLRRHRSCSETQL